MGFYKLYYYDEQDLQVISMFKHICEISKLSTTFAETKYYYL